jgi:hypothetical protein
MKACDPNRELRIGSVYSREAFEKFDRLSKDQKSDFIARAKRNEKLCSEYIWHELERVLV